MDTKELIKKAAKNSEFLSDLKTGTLHRALGIPEGQKIPTSLLQSLKSRAEGSHVSVGGKKVAVTGKLLKKVNFALNAKKWEH